MNPIVPVAILFTAAFDRPNYLQNTQTNSALFKVMFGENDAPSPNRVYSYQGFTTNNTDIFWHWFYLHDSDLLLTLALEHNVDYDDYDQIDLPARMNGTFGIYHWAETTGEDTMLVPRGQPLTEVQIFTKIRDFIVMCRPLHNFPYMFVDPPDIPLHYVRDNVHLPPMNNNTPAQMQQGPIVVVFVFHPAGPTQLVQHVKGNAIPHGAVRGGGGTFLVRGDSPQFLMQFPNNPGIPAVDLYPIVHRYMPPNRRFSARLRKFLQQHVGQCAGPQPAQIDVWVQMMLNLYSKIN